jgi:hypothetical protein
LQAKRKKEIQAYTDLLDFTLKQSKEKEGEEGYWTKKVTKYNIRSSEIPEEYYAFSQWVDNSGSLSMLFIKGGQLYNALTNTPLKKSEYRSKILPITLRK